MEAGEASEGGGGGVNDHVSGRGGSWDLSNDLKLITHF